jgi:hypothetical protein
VSIHYLAVNINLIINVETSDIASITAFWIGMSCYKDITGLCRSTLGGHHLDENSSAFASDKCLTRKSGVIIGTTVMLPQALPMCDSIGSARFQGATVGPCSESNQVAYGDNNREAHL